MRRRGIGFLVVCAIAMWAVSCSGHRVYDALVRNDSNQTIQPCRDPISGSVNKRAEAFCGQFANPTETSEVFLFYGEPRLNARTYRLRIFDQNGFQLDEEVFSWHHLESAGFLVEFNDNGIVPPPAKVVVHNTGANKIDFRIGFSSGGVLTELEIEPMSQAELFDISYEEPETEVRYSTDVVDDVGKVLSSTTFTWKQLCDQAWTIAVNLVGIVPPNSKIQTARCQGAKDGETK